MTTHALILDAIREMEKRGVEPDWSDWMAIGELLIEEEQLTKEEIHNESK